MMMGYMTTATLAVGLLAATPQAPQWKASYGKALEATRENDQPLLVVLDKPDSASARVEPALLSEGEVSGKPVELLKSYELCHVDVTTDYGQKVAKAFHVSTFPHVAIIDKTGSVIIYRKSGSIGAAEWQEILNRHRDGERISGRAVSHLSYKPVEAVTFEGSSPVYINNSYCPNCQSRSF
jgi:hypothetical protein